MRPDAGAPCVLCRLQSRPAMLFSAALGGFVVILCASLMGLVL